MDPVPVGLLVHMANFLQLHQPTPLLIMSEEETIPTEFCSGHDQPAVCIHYAARDTAEVAKNLRIRWPLHDMIFFSGGDHGGLLNSLSRSSEIFKGSSSIVMPGSYEDRVPHRLDSVIYFYNGTQSDGYSVWESYAVKLGVPSPRMILKWTPKGDQVQTLTDEFEVWERRRDLGGIVLTSGVLEWPRYLVPVIADDGAMIDATGFYPDILSELMARLNFTIAYVPSKDGNWGTRAENGSWNGLVSMLIDGEVDLVTCGLSIDSFREEEIDFSFPPITWEYATLLAPLNRATEFNFWAYTDIFPATVWALCTLYILAACFIFPFAGFRPSSNALQSLLTSISTRAGFDPKATTKAVELTFGLGIYLLFAYFSCDLTARMTTGPMELDIKSFEDAIALGYTVLVQRGTVEEHYLKNAPNGSAMKWVYDNQIIKEPFLNGDELLQRVVSEGKTLFYGGARVAIQLAKAGKQVP